MIRIGQAATNRLQPSVGRVIEINCFIIVIVRLILLIKDVNNTI